LLCIELKLLYVAITRAKNRVIIYDDFASRREPIQQYWQKLNCVHSVSKDMLDHPESMPKEIKDFYEIGINDASSSPDQWKI
jgi:ATP-dependent exoDNAse (exonuclease V) beta subunit